MQSQRLFIMIVGQFKNIIMTTIEKTILTAAVTVNAPVEKVWNFWTDPDQIIHWNTASDDWHTTKAVNDLRVGGRFLSRMEARDGSSGFYFTGEYTKIESLKQIEYTIDDGRKVQISFVADGNKTLITEAFENELTNPIEMQLTGWQSILDNFKKHVENSGKFEVLHFEIDIKSSHNHVYKTMLDEEKYAEWTAEFNPTSHFIGSWEKGSKILFLGTDKDGKTGGMVSKIKENIPGRFLSIQHIGIVQNGIEITCGPEIDEWAGILENYTFTPVSNNTLLSVDIDSNKEFKSYFAEKWPKALKKLKSICEHL